MKVFCFMCVICHISLVSIHQLFYFSVPTFIEFLAFHLGSPFVQIENMHRKHHAVFNIQLKTLLCFSTAWRSC